MVRKRDLPFSYGADLVDSPDDQDRRGRSDRSERPRAPRRSSGPSATDRGPRRPRREPSSPDAPRREPRERSRRRGRSWGQRALLSTGFVSVLILLVVLGTAVYALVRYLNIERIGDLGVDSAAADEPRNYLVVGSDERDLAEGSGVEGQRSDTLMVVRVDPAEGEAATLSIPRDLVVPIAGTGESDRINSAYAVDRATVVDTVRDALDIEVHHYVEVDFTSFESLVNALGGVDIWVEQAIKDEASGLFVDDLGCVSLDGETALAFVRSRRLQYMTEAGTWSEPDPSADLGRVDRQQAFVRQAVAEALDQVKSNPARLPEMVDVATGAVAIDDKMSVRELIAIAEAMSDVDPADHRSYSLPVVERGDGATLGLAEDEVDDVLDDFRDNAAADESAGTGRGNSGRSTASTSSEFQLGEPPAGESC